jgi:hypothetical protein
MSGCFALVLLTGTAFASPALAADLTGPNLVLTPGAVVSNDRDIACAFRDTPRLYQVNRSAYFEQARQVFKRYRIPYEQHRDWELDHAVPRCIGGSDEVRNLWPEPLAVATIKDAEEARICRAVCTEHTMSLDAGQRFFLSGQWQHQP